MRVSWICCKRSCVSSRERGAAPTPCTAGAGSGGAAPGWSCGPCLCTLMVDGSRETTVSGGDPAQVNGVAWSTSSIRVTRTLIFVPSLPRTMPKARVASSAANVLVDRHFSANSLTCFSYAAFRSLLAPPSSLYAKLTTDPGMSFGGAGGLPRFFWPAYKSTKKEEKRRGKRNGGKRKPYFSYLKCKAFARERYPD